MKVSKMVLVIASDAPILLFTKRVNVYAQYGDQ